MLQSVNDDFKFISPLVSSSFVNLFSGSGAATQGGLFVV